MTENMSLMLDGTSAFADVHHAKMVTPMLAKMKFGNTAMYGDEKGADNEKNSWICLKSLKCVMV